MLLRAAPQRAGHYHLPLVDQVRLWLVRLHRAAGLGLALFLFISGLTGAVISWDHEIDEWLNPQLFEAPSDGGLPALAPLELARRLEQADPRLRVAFLPLSVEPGHNLGVSVLPRIEAATGRPFALGFNQVTLNPVNGAIQGRRQWGAISLSREHFMPFLYKLHYSLHIPDAWGIELGVWFMGLVAVVWVVDCISALYIAFPNRRSWRKSFAFRLRQGGHKRVFDLHRSGGVWLWALLLVMALTSVSMNLGRELVRPVVALFSDLTPDIFATRVAVAPARFQEPGVAREQALDLARKLAEKRAWTAPAGAIFYSASYRLYGVNFFYPGEDHDTLGLGHPWLYFDAQYGEYIGDRLPAEGTWGDIYMRAQLPLHTGRIAGLPGRVLVSLLGLAVAGLSLTGLLIWLRRRSAVVSIKSNDAHAQRTP